MSTPVDKKRHMETQRAWLTTRIAQIQLNGWYGTLTVKFEGGVMRIIERMEKEIPPQIDES